MRTAWEDSSLLFNGEFVVDRSFLLFLFFSALVSIELILVLIVMLTATEA